MANYDNDRPPMNEGSPAVIQGSYLPAVQDGQVGLPAANVTQQFGHRSPEIIRSRMDQSGLLHSLRRRWLLATCLGLLVAATAGLSLWFLFPETNRATTLLRVHSTKQVVLDPIRNSSDTIDFDVFRNTQVSLVKSHFVLEAALRPQEVAEIPAVSQEENPEEWLREELDVRFPGNGEIMEISLAGQMEEDQLKAIVDSVRQAYIREAVDHDRNEQTRTRELLRDQYNVAVEKLNSDREEFFSLVETLGGSVDPNQSLDVKIALEAYRANRSERRVLQKQLADAYLQYQAILTQQRDEAIINQLVQESIAQNPSLQQLQMKLMFIDDQISNAKLNSRNRRSRSIARLEEKKQLLVQQMRQLEATERQRIMSQYNNAPNLLIKQARKIYELQRNVIQAQVTKLDQEAGVIQERMDELTKRSADLAAKQEELMRQSALVDAMGQRLSLMQVEQFAGARVQELQPAVAFESINTFQRYAIATIGGIIMLGLTCFGIGYMEFQNRRLNGPTQVDEGLGIRVVGTLPPLSGRRVAYEGDPMVASLMESVDSIRTTLMHDAASKDRRVVLVTSAATLEGRTTVASQLAASLARAGRRTLLIDGDLRHPALHMLFDLPLEDGLSEVLRTDAELDDVVRPTHAEGLWLLTAGYCDMDAIQAMANDQLQPIFDKLRERFDFIIVDGAPVLGMPDALMVGQQCDGAILSVLRDSSQVPKIYQAAEQLKAVGIRMIGAVVNGVRSKTDNRVVRPHLAPPRTREVEAVQPAPDETVTV